jgi:peptidoglycan L-alanyl-D-glutamate endopeptidase CwlK
MTYQFSQRSLENLEGVHPDLLKVVTRALEVTEQDFTVIDGLRTLEEQEELFESGKSKTMNSRHLTGHAVDIVPYPVTWEYEAFEPVVDAMRQAAQELGIQVTHGYDWGWDAAHHELSWKAYPA